MNESKNLILAVVLSALTIILWGQFFGKKPVQDIKNIEVINPQEIVSKQKVDVFLEKTETFADIYKKQPSFSFENNKIVGTISLVGGRIADLTLKDYLQSKDKEDKIHLLNPKNYFVELGFLSNNIKMPNKNSVWKKISTGQLAFNHPVTILWESKKLKIYRKFVIDKNYLIKIYNRIENKTNSNIVVREYGLINKSVQKLGQQLLILHEGPLGVFNEKLVEITYKKLKKKKLLEEKSARGGWVAMSDKYWISALIPESSKNYHHRFSFYSKNNIGKYQADFQSEDIVINANSYHQNETKLFSGAKEISLINEYYNNENIELFDRTIDFGILYFLTKPIYLLLKIFYKFFENFGVAIIALTIFIRFLVFPLASKSFKEMTKMKNIQPEVMKLRESYKDDKMKINKEVMSLYKKYKINPMMGCFPIFIQVFIFFALYKVLFVTIDMRHAEFFGWINDLSAPDPTSPLNLFGLLPFSSGLKLGIWPCLLCITMILQQKLNPAPADKMQAKMMKFLPYVFLILFASFPAGLVIYWTFSNLFSIAQQYLIMKKYGKPVKKN